jgi:UDP-N-acetylmuramate dehydrogenase
MPATVDIVTETNAQLPTWFGIGGRADRLARPTSIEHLRQCVHADPRLRVLGDGANLLVDDDGVSELVVSLQTPAFKNVAIEGTTLIAGSGADLPRLINEAVRRGLSGLECLAGIPASIGGAIIMNAGGAFGQIADCVARVHAMDRTGRELTLDREEIDFSYRHSGLQGLIITSVEFNLIEEDPAALRTRQLEIMQYKKQSQPLADRSAGCVFKNPTLHHDLEGIAQRGERVSAGMLIDRAGCKGMRVGGAMVSERHGNFIVTDQQARAGHVIELMYRVARRVSDAYGVVLEPEVVIWRRSAPRTEALQ